MRDNVNAALTRGEGLQIFCDGNLGCVARLQIESAEREHGRQG
jgi:hypothetical protein